MNEKFLSEEDYRDELEGGITSQTRHAKTSNNDKNAHQRDDENSNVENKQLKKQINDLQTILKFTAYRYHQQLILMKIITTPKK